MHAGIWPAEQTDLRSLHQAGPCAISGLARGPDQQQGTQGGGWWRPASHDLQALMQGPGGGGRSQRTLGTFSKLEVV